MMARSIAIVEAVRTPIGRFRGALAQVRADHLGAAVLDELCRRSGITADQIDDVVMGCVTQVGEQCGNVARTALLSAGWPETVPGLTIDRKCGSSEVAVHMATGQLVAGGCRIMVAGGVESMSRVPMGGNRDVHGEPFGNLLRKRFEMISQGESAERIADVWGFSRDDLDDYAFESHRRAAQASDSGYFKRETAVLDVARWAETNDAPPTVVSEDETIRRGTSREKLASLKTSFREQGRVTAGNSSQISDGAAALLMMPEDIARSHGLRPRARVRAMTTVGSDPTLMLTGPLEATRRVLAQASLSLEDIDLFEVNEAFAPVPLMWLHEFGDLSHKLNVNGGAIALGHPLGASGARLMVTLLHELERRDLRFGLQTMCCAGGLGTATIIERI